MSAGAEYGAQFHNDVAAFVDPEAVLAATVPGRRAPLPEPSGRTS